MTRPGKMARLIALLAAFALVAVACGSDSASSDETYTIGVSNTLVGNGWREQMICSIKAEALAAGNVDEVVIINENGGPAEQIGHIESLISQGVDAIVLNPTDRDALNDAIEEAINQGIVVVAVDQAVSAEGAYVVANDQVQYGELGARWLFDQLGGVGNVVEMRGIDGVPADTDRHEGFLAALADYPDINIVAETFTGWDPSTGAQQALDLITTQDVDGIWTSGIDYTVVNQFETANVPFVPIVGADNNGFVEQLINVDGLVGVAVTNPPTVGGVGTAIALQALAGDDPDAQTILTPDTIDNVDNTDALSDLYLEGLEQGFVSTLVIEPYSQATEEQVLACKGPGEA